MKLAHCRTAVPFEEDERDPSIWFLDHSYLENMAAMYKKVNGVSLRRSWHHCCATLQVMLFASFAMLGSQHLRLVHSTIVTWLHSPQKFEYVH
jgi:uncharacterized membrane protein YbaN (DUF454 family)